MKFYITKWALTKGILEEDCEVYKSPEGTEYAHKGSIYVRIGVDAFENEDDAKIRVRKLIDTKLKSLERTRLKLLKLRKEMS